MRFFGWFAAFLIAGTVLIIMIAGPPKPSPEEIARDRARDCLTTWQYKFANRGYAYEDGRVGAVMQCTAELQEVKRYAAPK